MNSPRIALIHATPLAIEPVNAVFRSEWPEAQCVNLLEDSLTTDLQRLGMGPAIMGRMMDLASYQHRQGADAILFTCSAFGPAIDAVKAALPIPVLKPNEAMFDEALAMANAHGPESCLGLLTTFGPSSVSMREELQTAIADRGLTLTVAGACAQAAMGHLLAGDAQTHDRLILDAAAQLASCAVYLLGQFSMARAQAQVAQQVGRPVLTSPGSAVSALRRQLPTARTPRA